MISGQFRAAHPPLAPASTLKKHAHRHTLSQTHPSPTKHTCDRWPTSGSAPASSSFLTVATLFSITASCSGVRPVTLCCSFNPTYIQQDEGSRTHWHTYAVHCCVMLLAVPCTHMTHRTRVGQKCMQVYTLYTTVCMVYDDFSAENTVFTLYIRANV